MTEKRLEEIRDAALDIIDHSADLQTAVRHGGLLPEDTADRMFASLQGIKELAASMMRAHGTRFDPEEKARIGCLNTLNALRAQLDNINKKNTMDDMNLYRLSAILENAQHKVKKYVLTKNDREVA